MIANIQSLYTFEKLISGGLGEFVCEPDEYAQLVQELKTSGIIKDHRSGFSVHKNSFTGKDFVNWVVKSKGLGRFDRSTCMLLSFLALQ